MLLFLWGNSRQKEETTKLLCLMIKETPTLVINYTAELLDVLLRASEDDASTPVVEAHVLTCLGELAQVAGENIGPKVMEIMNLVIRTLQDSASPTIKRDAALRTLGQVASFTGTVVDPYVDYPELLVILSRLVKVESAPHVRKETIRVIGILGALDPYRRKVLFEKVDESAKEHIRSQHTDISLLMTTAGSQSNEDYFQAVAFNSLVGIISDPGLSALHYTKAMDAMIYIFLTQGLKCVSFLPQVVPAMLSAIRLSSPAYQGPWLTKLGSLISVVKQHIRNFIDPILSIVLDFWDHPSLQTVVIQLVEVTARALEGEFKAFIPRLLTVILRTFDADSSKYQSSVLVALLHALGAFGLSIEEYTHLILPAILKLLDQHDTRQAVKETAINTIGVLARQVNFSEQASQIIHPLSRVVLAANPSDKESEVLANLAMNALCSLVIQLGSDYAIFIPMMDKIIKTSKVQHPAYDQLVAKILKRERLPQEFGKLNGAAVSTEVKATAPAQSALNQQSLKQTWDTSVVSTSDEWRDWAKGLGSELLRESPSVALRACQDLSEEHEPLNRELFNVAFISCWVVLYEPYQEDLVNSIAAAISAPNCPPEVVNLLLNLCEFAEHDDKVLPLDPKMLGQNVSISFLVCSPLFAHLADRVASTL